MDIIAKISSSGLLTMILIAFHRTSAVLYSKSAMWSPPLPLCVLAAKEALWLYIMTG